MSKSRSLLSSVPGSYTIILVRAILLILSIAGLIVYAITVSIYNNSVAPNGALAPPRGSSSILTVNVVTIVSTILSTVWSIMHLIFLARRLHESYSRGRRRNSNGGEEWSGSGKPVIHPGWIVLFDTIFWVWFIIMAVLTGEEASRWRNGTLDIYGSAGTRKVDLKACPTFDPASGKTDYWCLHEWNKFVDLSQSGTSILGTLAGMHSGRVGTHCYEWYILHRYRRLSGGWCWRPSIIEDTTGSASGPSDQTKDIELERT